MLIVGLIVVIGGVAISRRQLLRPAVAAFAIAAIALGLAARRALPGEHGGLVIGPMRCASSGRDADRRWDPTSASGVALPSSGLLAALAFWSFLWAGAYGLLARRTGTIADPRILC